MMNKNIVTMLTLGVLLAGCQGISFNSNLGAFASSRVKVAAVEEYTHAEIARRDAMPLGGVEASYCQKRIEDRRPAKGALVDELKARVYHLGGNVLVLEACSQPLLSGSCTAYMECRGQAYSLSEG
jgi:hypothetical protein